MKKFRINIRAAKYILTASLAMGMFSCQESLLSPTPKTSIKTENVFDTADRVLLLVNGMYTSAKNGNVLGGRVQIYGDVRANDFINRTSNGVTAYTVWNQQLNENSQNDVINFWTFAYQAINDINNVIAGLQDQGNIDKMVPPNFPVGFDATRKAYIAEGKFLRAVLYHYLLQFYAAPYTYSGLTPNPGVPLRIQAETNSENNLLPRATVQEVYTQILKDLDEAELDLPLTYSNATLRTTRAHKNSAIAFKTRVYLTMGNWQKVVDEANKIVPAAAPFTATGGGVPNTLTAKVVDTFAPPQETAEWILGFPFNANNTPGTQNQIGFYYRSSSGTNPGGGEFNLNSSAGSIVANTTDWPANDDRRVNFVYKVGSDSYLGKYPSGTPYTDKAPVMRWSEVLLNLAEARAHLTGTVDAQSVALLNAVRTRSNSAARNPADNATLITNIMTERRIEFLGEGLRTMDIMRTLDVFPAKGSVGQLALHQLNYVWPIPSTERAVNTVCDANNILP
jgi:hypothetical protein